MVQMGTAAWIINLVLMLSECFEFSFRNSLNSRDLQIEFRPNLDRSHIFFSSMLLKTNNSRIISLKYDVYSS